MKRSLSISLSGSPKSSQNDVTSIETSDCANSDDDRDKREKKRRDQFNCLIGELCSIINYELHSPTATAESNAVKKMDKSSILRSAISFIRANNCKREANSFETAPIETTESDGQLRRSVYSWKPSFLLNDEFIYLLLEAFDSFVVILEANERAKVIYVSDQITALLGSPISSRLAFDRTHRNSGAEQITIYDLIHPDERNIVETILAPNTSAVSSVDLFGDSFVSIYLHFKDNTGEPECDRTYQLVRLLGSFYECESNQVDADSGPNGANDEHYFVAVCRLQTPKLLRELSVDSIVSNDTEFVSRHSLEWKFLYLDCRAAPIIGYVPFEILGTSGYDYYHWDDLDMIVRSHEKLMQSGEELSPPYRFLTKSQHWLWLKSRYRISYHHWNSKPEFIVCSHSVVKDGAQIDAIRGQLRRCEPSNSVSALESQQSTLQSSSSYGSSTQSSESEFRKMVTTSLIGGDSIRDSPIAETDNNGEEVHRYLFARHQQLRHHIEQQQHELRRLSQQITRIQSNSCHRFAHQSTDPNIDPNIDRNADRYSTPNNGTHF